ncbi:MAG TPA: ABC transporter substrate-binding protein [bacterium]|nr:ABC transporter substrate-binding protein [bacterium]
MAQRALVAAVAAVLGVALLGGTRGHAARALSFVLDTTPNRATEAQAIAAQLGGAGINAQVRVWQLSVLIPQIQAGQRAVYTTDWGSAYFDPYDLAVPKFVTKARGNFSFYSNAAVDHDMAVASGTPNEAQRRAAYLDAQRKIYGDAPWVFGYVLRNIEAESSAVSGWVPAADNSETMYPAAVRGADTITMGMRNDAIAPLDPGLPPNDREAVLRNIFDALVGHTPDGKVVPQLATSWRRVGPAAYDFALRPGVKFQNGDPVTADDVVFTFQRVLTPGAISGYSSTRKDLLGPILRVQKLDDSHVRFVYSATFPEALVLQSLVHFQIVPQKYVQQAGEGGFIAKPVGAGPFRFVRGALNSEIVLERYDGYWGGPAKVRQVIFRMLPEPSGRIAALLSGEVHVIQEVPPDLVDRLKTNPNVQVRTAEGTRSYEIEFNTKAEPFNDPRVRQALNYAVNWDPILRDIYHGYGTRLSTAFLPNGFGYDPALKPYPYDPAKARELLRQAGY